MKIQIGMIVGAVALLIGLLLGWMARGILTYNSNAGMVASYDDWRVACPSAATKGASCELVSDIIDKSQQSPIARATITTDSQGKPLIGFMLPYGVALQAGMGLVVGKEPVKVYPYRTCNAVGCIATAPFDQKLADSMRQAKDGRVMFANLQGKAVGVPLSFKGYDTAFRAYKSAEAKRHEWFWRLWS